MLLKHCRAELERALVHPWHQLYQGPWYSFLDGILKGTRYQEHLTQGRRWIGAKLLCITPADANQGEKKEEEERAV